MERQISQKKGYKWEVEEEWKWGWKGSDGELIGNSELQHVLHFMFLTKQNWSGGSVML